MKVEPDHEGPFNISFKKKNYVAWLDEIFGTKVFDEFDYYSAKVHDQRAVLHSSSCYVCDLPIVAKNSRSCPQCQHTVHFDCAHIKSAALMVICHKCRPVWEPPHPFPVARKEIGSCPLIFDGETLDTSRMIKGKHPHDRDSAHDYDRPNGVISEGYICLKLVRITKRTF